MKKIFLLLLLIVSSVKIIAHPWKPNHYVIIDSDGGTDDLKAISLLLASPDVRVLAIIASPGAVDAETAYIKIKSMLNSYWHEGVPVGINRQCTFRSPMFELAADYKWGEESGANSADAPDYLSLLRDIFKYEKTKISFICLGGLTTAANAMKEIPEFSTSVKEIIWSCAGLKDKKGFNYMVDGPSASLVLSGKIPVNAVHRNSDYHFYDAEFISRLDSSGTCYAKKILEFQNHPQVKSHDFSALITDELVPLFLHFPDAFESTGKGTNFDCTPLMWPRLKDGYIRIISGATVMKNQVIKSFPEDPSFYFPDVEPFVTEIIRKYGESEWSSGVLANELHRHLGVFAIIGVKMGIRAREYFDTGVDEFRATSFAGSEPPLSCMNDGLQVSTGATPGHGLLTVVNDSVRGPVAEFSYMNHRIRLSLNKDIASTIGNELKEINFVYGLDSNIYWELVRKNTLKYWKDLDRHNIFIIDVLK